MASQLQPTIERRAALNPALRDFWAARNNEKGEPIRNRVLYGGRASSKSWDAAGYAIWVARNFKTRFLCVRQFQNKIDESVYTLLKIQIERFGAQGEFRILENKIIHKITGSEFIFYGLWRHIGQIKSLEGVDVCWVEEAHDLTSEQWAILDPTIRKEHSEIWLIFNPMLATDFAYKRFVTNPPYGTIKRLINYLENPFLSDTMRRLIDAAKAEDFDEYSHVYLGVPKDDDDDAIIKRTWAMAAIGAHKALHIEPTGARRTGFDIADGGADLCATVEAHGPLVTWSDMWKAREDELLKSATRVWTRARATGATILYDSIGVGASAGAKFNELNVPLAPGDKVRYGKFNAGGAVYRPDAMYAHKVKNRDMFANLKAQTWWSVGDRMRNTFNAVRQGHKFKPDKMIFIDETTPNLERIIDELTTPKRDFDLTGKVKVESKKDLAKRDVSSPNLADAFVMPFSPGNAIMSISADALRSI